MFSQVVLLWTPSFKNFSFVCLFNRTLLLDCSFDLIKYPKRTAACSCCQHVRTSTEHQWTLHSSYSLRCIRSIILVLSCCLWLNLYNVLWHLSSAQDCVASSVPSRPGWPHYLCDQTTLQCQVLPSLQLSLLLQLVTSAYVMDYVAT